MIEGENTFDVFAHALLEASQGIGDTIAGLIPVGALQSPVGAFTLGDLLLIVAVVAGTLLLRWLVVWLLERLFDRLIERSHDVLVERWADVVLRLASYVILLAGLFLLAAGVRYPRDPIDIELGIWRFVTSIILMFFGMLAFRVLMLVLHYLSLQHSRHDRGLIDERMLPLFRDGAKVLMIIIVAIMIVQVWGYSAATILAGVGLGGLALAFAAQDSIANVFGSMVIYTDKPYRVGDWVMIAGIEGTIEEIGIRSTRIRTFDNTLISVPNKTIANENIQNFEAVRLRRIKFSLGVKYSTPPELLELVRDRILELIDAHPELSTERVVVRFWAFGASSLDFLVQCFTPQTRLMEYARVQEGLLLSIFRALHDIGVEVAFPSQSIYLEQMDRADETQAG